MKQIKILPYRKDLTLVARKLRNNAQLSEVLLWNQLKRNQLCGYDFHRQKPILDYIVDFYCPELMLAIEIDGKYHLQDETATKDIKRQKLIEELGVSFLRFTDSEVRFQMQSVINHIDLWIEDFEIKKSFLEEGGSRSETEGVKIFMQEHTPSRKRDTPLKRGINHAVRRKV